MIACIATFCIGVLCIVLVAYAVHLRDELSTEAESSDRWKSYYQCAHKDYIEISQSLSKAREERTKYVDLYNEWCHKACEFEDEVHRLEAELARTKQSLQILHDTSTQLGSSTESKDALLHEITVLIAKHYGHVDEATPESFSEICVSPDIQEAA
jgi:predicted nuclease with TOPRIM domain